MEIANIIYKNLKLLKLLFIYSRKKLFDPAPEEPDYVPLPELANIRPGGFDWGNQNQNQNVPENDEGNR